MLDLLKLMKDDLEYDTKPSSENPSVTIILAPPATGKTRYVQNNQEGDHVLYIVPDNFRTLHPKLNVANYTKYELEANAELGNALSHLIVGAIKDKKTFVLEDPFIEGNANMVLSFAKKNGYTTKVIHLSDNNYVNGFLSQSRIIDFINNNELIRYVDKQGIEDNIYNIHKEMHNLIGWRLVDKYEFYSFDYQNVGGRIERGLNLVTRDIREWKTHYDTLQNKFSAKQYRFVKDLTKKIDAFYDLPTSNKKYEGDWVKIKTHFEEVFARRYEQEIMKNIDYINLAIIGTRKFENYETFKKEVDTYIEKNNVQVMKIISGGEKGTDSLARRYALEHNLLLEEYLPDIKKQGVASFHIRNKQIVENSDRVLAFWSQESKGAESSLGFARNFKKPIEVVEVSDREIFGDTPKKKFEQVLQSIDISRLPSFENPIATFATTGKNFLQEFGSGQKKEYSFYLEHTILVKMHPEFTGNVEEIMKKEDYKKGIQSLLSRLMENKKSITFVSTFIQDGLEKNLREKGYTLEHKQLYLSKYEDRDFQAVEKPYTSEKYIPSYYKNEQNEIKVRFDKIEAFDLKKEQQRICSVDFFLANKDKNPQMNYEIMNNKEYFTLFNESLNKLFAIDQVLQNYKDVQIIKMDSTQHSMVFKVDGAENIIVDKVHNRWFERGDGDVKSKGMIDLAMRKPFLFNDSIEGTLGFADAKSLLLDFYLAKDTQNFEGKAKFYEGTKREFMYEEENFGNINTKGYQYLTKRRGLDGSSFSKTSEIVSSVSNPKELCFLYKTSKGEIAGVEKVNTETGAKSMIVGSNKAEGLFFKVGDNTQKIKNIYVCESVIDALSFEQMYLKNEKEYLIVATGGQVSSRQGQVLKDTIENLSHKFVSSPQIFDCFDNDLAGTKNAERFMASFGSSYNDTFRSNTKDWNDDLKKGITLNEILKSVESSVKKTERLNEKNGFDDKAVMFDG